MNKDNKNSISILTLIGSIIISIVVFVILISVQDSMIKEIETTTIVVAKKDIPKNTEIELKKINDYFVEMEIPKYNVVKKTFANVKEITNNKKYKDSVLIITEEISANEQLQKKHITTENSPLKTLDEPVEIGFEVKGFGYGVGGRIRKGDIIDIFVVNSVTGIEECIASDIYVCKALDSTGVEINIEDKETLAIAFNVLVESNYKDEFVVGLEKGTIRLVKKNDITE